jgi:hypothetical protein
MLLEVNFCISSSLIRGRTWIYTPSRLHGFFTPPAPLFTAATYSLCKMASMSMMEVRMYG